MHRTDNVAIDEALKTTNLALKSIVGHEKAGYNKTTSEIKNISNRLNATVNQMTTLNNILRNLTTAVNMMIKLEVNVCHIYNNSLGAINIMNKFGVYIEGINA